MNFCTQNAEAYIHLTGLRQNSVYRWAFEPKLHELTSKVRLIARKIRRDIVAMGRHSGGNLPAEYGPTG